MSLSFTRQKFFLKHAPSFFLKTLLRSLKYCWFEKLFPDVIFLTKYRVCGMVCGKFLQHLPNIIITIIIIIIIIIIICIFLKRGILSRAHI